MENKSLRVNFVCPEPGCGCKEVEEVLVHVMQFTTIDGLETWDDGSDPICDHGVPDYDGDTASVDRYCCGECGMALEDETGMTFSSTPDLYEWLNSRGMLEEIE